jgi:hypothetical protein
VLPPLPTSVVCFNGLVVGSAPGFAGGRWGTSDAMCVRMDYRRALPDLGLARTGAQFVRRDSIGGEIAAKAWESALEAHLNSTTLARGDNAWYYKQRLMREFTISDWWRRQPSTIPHYISAVRTLSSIGEVVEADVISVLLYTAEYSSLGVDPNLTPQRLTTRQLSRDSGVPVLVDWEVNRFSELAGSALFGNRGISSVRLVGKRFVAVDWSRSADVAHRPLGSELLVGPLSNRDVIGFRLHRTRGGQAPCFLNSRSEFVQWLIRIKAASDEEGSRVTRQQYEALLAVLDTPLKIRGYKHADLRAHLNGWAAADVPPALRPTGVELGERSFVPPNDRGRRYASRVSLLERRLADK